VSASEGELLRTLHDQHAGALWGYVVNLTNGDRAKAQDVVQETLLRGWLFTVAKRIVIDEWRASRSRPEYVTDQVPEQSVSDKTEQSVDRQLVVAALRTLSAEHRDVLLECYFRGSSVAEAAATLGVPPGTVKSRTHYALRALRLALEEMGGVL